MPDTIKNIISREILDSRGNPTVEVDVTLKNGSMGRAAVPSGASTGSKEALELRDNCNTRYLGKGVQNAITNIQEKIAPKLVGKTMDSLPKLDKYMCKLDGTKKKSNLGANAILGVSMALARAAAISKKQPLYTFLNNLYYDQYQKKSNHPSKQGTTLPTPMMNILNGGEHADNSLSIQEFMIVPQISDSFKESLRCGVEVFHHLKKCLHKNNLSTNIGDEGGFAPNIQSNEEAFELIIQAISYAGYRPGQDVFLAIDAAATEFQTSTDTYEMSGAPTPKMNSQELIHYYSKLCSQYPLISIEDGLGENDWEGWKQLTQKQGKNTTLIGDDIFVTNVEILKKGIKEKIGNAILIKLNQIGTVSETLETIAFAQTHGYNTIISHRSGETEDTFLADLAVATDAGLIKTGSASRSDRMAKYNQLLRIEESLGKNAHFLGLQAFGNKL